MALQRQAAEGPNGEATSGRRVAKAHVDRASQVRLLARRRRARVVHVAMLVAYVTVWTGYVIWAQRTHYLSRHYTMVDTGLVADLIYRTTVYGEFLSSPTVDGSHLFRHINPTILLMAPCLWLSPSGWGLIWGNVVVVALGAIPCALLSWRITRHPLLVHVVVLWYLTNRMLITNLHFPHFELLFCPLVLGLLYTAYRRLWLFYSLLLLLNLGVRADVGLPLALFGVVLVLRGQYLVGLLTTSTALVVPAVLVLWVIPQMGYPGASADLWSAYGDSWTEIFICWLRHPLSTCQRALDSGLPSLFAATGGLLLLSPTASLLTAVSVFLSVMSDLDWRRSLELYNSAAAIPWMVWGLSLGLRRLVVWWRASRRHLSPRMYRRTLRVVLVAVAVLPATTIYGMFWRYERDSLHLRMIPADQTTERDRHIFAYLQHELPLDASVAAHSDLYVWIPYRRGLTTLEEATSCRYVVIDQRGKFEKTPTDRAEQLYLDLRRSSAFRIAHQHDGFYVFEALTDSQRLP